MSVLPVVVEPTALIRDLLRSENVGGIGSRVWAGGLPDAAVFPALVVHRIAGGGISGAVELVSWQLDCWAVKASEAAALAGAVQTWLVQLDRTDMTATGATVRLLGAVEETVTAGPSDPPDDPTVHRFIVTAELAVITIPNPTT